MSIIYSDACVVYSSSYNQRMNLGQFNHQVETLPHYQNWYSAQAKNSEFEAQRTDSPRSAQHHRVIADHLDHLDVVEATNHQLAIDALHSDLPDIYKSGLTLSIFNQIPSDRHVIFPLAVDVYNATDNNISFEDFAIPSTNTIVRAHQIGASLADLQRKLRRPHPVPAVLISRDRTRQQEWYDVPPSHARYFLIHPLHGLTINLAEEHDSKITLPVPLPTLCGTIVSQTNGHPQPYMEPRQPGDRIQIPVPHVEQLAKPNGHATSQKLIVGAAAVALFARRHKEEKSTWLQKMTRRNAHYNEMGGKL